MQIRDFLKIYGALVLFHLAVIYREDSGQMLYLSKPLILGSLLVYSYSRIKDYPKSWLWLLPALLFSLLGDIALMFTEQSAFLIGMGSFALAHLSYILFYGQQKPKLRVLPVVLALVIAVFSISLLLNWVTLPKDLELPIYGYFLFLSIHLVYSALAFADKQVNHWPLIGILLFIFSDWWIAYSKFGGGLDEHWHNRVIIMLTYGLAQAAIVLGLFSKPQA